MERIILDRQICSGKPVIKGTRIMVKTLLGMFAGGYSIEKILELYPEITKEDIVAAIDYAGRVIDEEKVIIRS